MSKANAVKRAPGNGGVGKGAHTIAYIAAILTPLTAQAQRIPDAVAAVVVSPLLFLVLSIALGFLNRSWRVAGIHAGLMILWPILTWIAFLNFGNHVVTWLPLGAYAVHAIVILVLLVLGAVRRIRGRGRL